MMGKKKVLKRFIKWWTVETTLISRKKLLHHREYDGNKGCVDNLLKTRVTCKHSESHFEIFTSFLVS